MAEYEDINHKSIAKALFFPFFECTVPNGFMIEMEEKRTGDDKKHDWYPVLMCQETAIPVFGKEFGDESQLLQRRSCVTQSSDVLQMHLADRVDRRQFPGWITAWRVLSFGHFVHVRDVVQEFDDTRFVLQNERINNLHPGLLSDPERDRNR